ncbi:secreted RxLR effector protein 161-like [Hibiscus syriacus]|uniref:secreted RxLR effector protein 161-like n=1 Tax=Hibiscus syriacus TaxID=106335 RepID=UPI0019204666|nr:secreted RxLR effector protein 161-like [Hibiscus syriacus]
MVLAPKLKANDGQLLGDVHLYRSVMGGLQYVCLTRPDIAYAVNKVSQYMNSPCDTHWRAVKHILRYLSGTLEYGLFFSQTDSFSLVYYTDADWAASIIDRRSTTGYCVYLGGNPIAWCSKKQSVVSRSTSEAEYRSLANSVFELIWIEQLLDEIVVSITGKTIVWCDNTSAISMAANPTHYARIKHVKIDIHFVRERVLAEQLSVNFVPSTEQVANILTKPLSPVVFSDMCSHLGVKSWVEINSS